MDTARPTGQDNAPVIACDLGGDEIRAQVERWARLWRDAGLERVETEDGLRIRFRDEPAVGEELRVLTALESKCCSWARWEVCRADGNLILTVSSTPEGAATLHTMFGTGSSTPRILSHASGAARRMGFRPGSALQRYGILCGDPVLAACRFDQQAEYILREFSVDTLFTAMLSR